MDAKILEKIADDFILRPPKLGLAPPRVDQLLMARLLPYKYIRGTVMRLADRYYRAGCPLDLVETAACRDIWTEAVNQTKTQSHESKNNTDGRNAGH
jgi:hypothetical protein